MCFQRHRESVARGVSLVKKKKTTKETRGYLGEGTNDQLLSMKVYDLGTYAAPWSIFLYFCFVPSGPRANEIVPCAYTSTAAVVSCCVRTRVCGTVRVLCAATQSAPCVSSCLSSMQFIRTHIYNIVKPAAPQHATRESALGHLKAPRRDRPRAIRHQTACQPDGNAAAHQRPCLHYSCAARARAHTHTPKQWRRASNFESRRPGPPRRTCACENRQKI